MARTLYPHDEGEQKTWMKLHQKRLLDQGRIEKLVDALRSIQSGSPEVANKLRQVPPPTLQTRIVQEMCGIHRIGLLRIFEDFLQSNPAARKLCVICAGTGAKCTQNSSNQLHASPLFSVSCVLWLFGMGSTCRAHHLLS